MIAALAFLALALAQPQDAPVVTGHEPGAVRVQVSGAFGLHLAYREDRVNEVGITMNTGVVPPDRASDDYWSGTFSLRLDVDAGDGVGGVFELENRDFDEGTHIPFGDPSEVADPVNLQQAYIHVDDFLAEGLALRAGVQEFALRNRPHDEPFFIDLGHVESFNAGYTIAGYHVRNTLDRDVREAAGIRVLYDLNEATTAQLMMLTVGEVGSLTSDETLYLALLNAGGERHAGWLMTAVVAGNGAREQVWTFGVGSNNYFGADRQLEFFGEAYLQKGFLANEVFKVRKDAYAANAGFRVVGLLDERLATEAAYSIRTGNSHPNDRTDETFQSYENVNRFIVLQSAEFGIDFDTNVRIGRWGLEYGPVDLGGRPLTLQFDAGLARADAPLRSPTGQRLFNRRRWGWEFDVKARLAYTSALSFTLHGGYMPRSPLVEATNENRFHSAKTVVLTAELAF